MLFVTLKIIRVAFRRVRLARPSYVEFRCYGDGSFSDVISYDFSVAKSIGAPRFTESRLLHYRIGVSGYV